MSTGYHALSVKTDGALWAWGYNFYGQLGDGTTTDKHSPAQIGTATNWSKVSTGSNHTLAIKTDGTLWAWGQNHQGQLGDGTITDRHSPTQIGTATNWSKVNAGANHTLAIKTDGTLWAWGENANGELGDGTITDRLSPVQIGTATDWSALGGGASSSSALKADGTIWSWGYNADGRLGLGNTTSPITTPTQVGTATNWKDIDGYGHRIAIKTDGTLWAWGYNNHGQVGDGGTAVVTSPKQIGTATDWNKVNAGGLHSLAIKTNGTLWAWGLNSNGQLGDGTTTNRLTPTQIGTATDWNKISTNLYSSYRIKTDGTLWSWGYNHKGQLGDGTITNRLSPTQIGTATNWSILFNSIDVTTKTVVKYLFEDGTDIKKWDTSLATPAWVLVGASPVTEAMFVNDGMANLTAIGNAQLQALTSNTPKLLTYTDDTTRVAMDLNLTAVPPNKIILANGDIDLTRVDNIDSFTLTANVLGGGVVKSIVSFDGGISWYAWDASLATPAWVLVDVTLTSDVKTKGMTPTVLNGVASASWQSLRGTSNTVRFGYYLEQSASADTANTDKLDSQFDMKGVWKKYNSADYEYQDNSTLSVTVYDNGDYKINH